MTTMQDITGPEVLEVVIRQDSKVVWINIDGICAFRACQIKQLIVEDRRRDDDGIHSGQ